MSKAAELIADLQSTAKLDSEGGFTLDREKARQKMRQFQLDFLISPLLFLESFGVCQIAADQVAGLPAVI